MQRRANQVWRRRRCVICNNAFTTTETADLALSLRFRSSQGNLEPFSREKLLLSIYESCRHRKDALEASTDLTNTVIAKLRPSFKHAMLERPQVIDAVFQTLKHFDRTAALVYLAYRAKD